MAIFNLLSVLNKSSLWELGSPFTSFLFIYLIPPYYAGKLILKLCRTFQSFQNLIITVAFCENSWSASIVKLAPSPQQIPCFHHRETNIGWKLLSVTSPLCSLFVWYFLLLHLSGCLSPSKHSTQSCSVRNSYCFGHHLTGNLFLLKWSQVQVLNLCTTNSLKFFSVW